VSKPALTSIKQQWETYESGHKFNDYRTLISKVEYYAAPLLLTKVAVAAARDEMDPNLACVKARKIEDHLLKPHKALQ
jgi:hypothetical protein